MKKLTTEEFIEKAKEVHCNKYDYSKVEYQGNKKKVFMICPEHGEFWQTPNDHLNNHGCPKCGSKFMWDNRGRLTIEEFIEKAKKIHGNKYDYSKTKYINNGTKVCIICPEHGEFYQTPHGHLIGKGCPKCYGNIKSTTEEFINKSIQVHTNKYDYSKVNYVNDKKKVCIICYEHGEFLQIPNNHLNGQGCPICKESKLEIDVAKLLDENNIICERQKRFKWLGRQSLDFYLTDYNVGIECQGRQHFKSIDYFGGEDGFLKTVERDEKKFNLCKKHDIEIVYYTNVTVPEDYEKYVYTDKNELLKAIQIT